MKSKTEICMFCKKCKAPFAEGKLFCEEFKKDVDPKQDACKEMENVYGKVTKN